MNPVVGVLLRTRQSANANVSASSASSDGAGNNVLMVGIALMPDRPDCDVLLHEDGTWSEDGWSVISSGTTWCDLNPEGRVVGQPYLHWDRTWHIPS